jgi:hypothetical protein
MRAITHFTKETRMSTKERVAPPYTPAAHTVQAMSSVPPAPPIASKHPAQKTHAGPKSQIRINYDVGYANILYLRGQGAGLSWNKGLKLTNVKADEWIWESSEPFTSCEFKVLINDKEYEQGDNHTLTCGASMQYTPHFN